MGEDTVHLGHVLKPAYIARAQKLGKAAADYTRQAERANSMSRHPAVRNSPRRKEFEAQSSAYTEKAFHAGGAIMDIVHGTGESFSRRGNFHTAANAQYN